MAEYIYEQNICTAFLLLPWGLLSMFFLSKHVHDCKYLITVADVVFNVLVSSGRQHWRKWKLCCHLLTLHVIWLAFSGQHKQMFKAECPGLLNTEALGGRYLTNVSFLMFYFILVNIYLFLVEHSAKHLLLCSTGDKNHGIFIFRMMEMFH